MIRIAILGCGRVIAGRYLDVFGGEVSGCRVVVACDPVLERARSVASTLACEASDDPGRVLAREDVDAVLVATESGSHDAVARSALQQGKHVIVEKPPAMIPDEILTTERMAKEARLMYAVILQNRFNPAMVALKQAVEAGRFGRLVGATVRLRWCRPQAYYEDGWHGTWKMDGGVINQQAFHHVDGVQWLCGPIASVVAAQDNALNRLEAEDTTFATVRFEGGFLGAIEATTAARPEDVEASISIMGEGGLAVVGGIALNRIDVWSFVDARPEDETAPQTHSQEVPTGYGLSHGPLVQAIVDRLSEGRTDPPITGSDAVPAVRAVHAMYRSTEVGGWVDVGPDTISERLGR